MINAITISLMLSTIPPVDMENPLGLDNPNVLAGKQYAPTGCVAASFQVDENGKAFDIKLELEVPEKVFTNQAFTNISRVQHRTTQGSERRNVYYQFDNNSKWPLPFECLQSSSQIELTKKIDAQYLSEANLGELKKAIDSRVFNTVFNNIKTENSEPQIKKISDNNYSATITIKWDSDIEEAYNLLSYYFEPTFGATVNNEIRTMGIFRDKLNKEIESEYNEQILNYVGQRTFAIEVNLNNKKHYIAMGAPIDSQKFCQGNVTTYTDFDSYCVTFKNNKGTEVTFENLTEDDLKAMEIKTRFVIKNSFLRERD